MIDENGVRVHVIKIELRQDMMTRTIHFDMSAIVREEYLYDGPVGMSDLNKLHRLYQWHQGGRGLWLTLPPTETPPIKIVQSVESKVKRLRRRIIIDD